MLLFRGSTKKIWKKENINPNCCGLTRWNWSREGTIMTDDQTKLDFSATLNPHHLIC
jgi:hypothetical protein